MPLLIHLLKHEQDIAHRRTPSSGGLALVFCNRKHFASKLAKRLTSQGVHARSLHGDLSQSQRERVTNDFRQKRFNVLVATDVAARGLHIEDITHVYNYEIPRDVESYTHRVGRTARAGKQGEAISLVATIDEQKFFKQILFNFRGSISLQTLQDVKLQPLPKHDGEKHSQQNSTKPKVHQSHAHQEHRGKNHNRKSWQKRHR